MCADSPTDVTRGLAHRRRAPDHSFKDSRSGRATPCGRIAGRQQHARTSHFPHRRKACIALLFDASRRRNTPAFAWRTIFATLKAHRLPGASMKRDSGKPDKQSAASEPAGAGSQAQSAQAAFASYAAPLVDRAIELAHAVRDDTSPEALHQLRVSLRRLRSLWWAFHPLLEQAENRRQRALFKYLATAAGKTRDWDIVIQLLSTEGSGAQAMTPR